eukprot:COSAG03_NODE_25790_length_263_cov_0.926829_1_plen_40_part_10
MNCFEAKRFGAYLIRRSRWNFRVEPLTDIQTDIQTDRQTQ